MRRLIGLIAFFIAIGMLVMLFINNRFIGIIIIAFLVVLGYVCFCND